MVKEDKKSARELMESFLKLKESDRKYVKGWVDAKADSNTEKKEAHTACKN